MYDIRHKGEYIIYKLSFELYSTYKFIYQVAREVANKYGCLVANPGSNEVLHYVEKPESFISDLISCGIYLFNCAIFDEMKKAMQNKHQVGYPLIDISFKIVSRL